MTVSKNKFIIFLQILMFSFVSISAVFAQDIDNLDNNTQNEEPKYEVEYTQTDQGDLIITNRHVPEKIDVIGGVIWDDASDQDGVRPTEVTIQLYNGEEKIDEKTIVLTPDDVTDEDPNIWEQIFEQVYKYQNKGEEIDYSIRVVTPDDENYTYTFDGDTDKFHSIGTHVILRIDVTGDIIFDDDENRDGIRPDEVTVQIYQNGDPFGEPIPFDSEDDWKYLFENLPKNKEGEVGEPAVYTAGVPGEIPEYTVTYDEETGNITVTHIPYVKDVNIKKIWDDINDQDGIRPDSICVILHGDTIDYTYELSAADKTDDNTWAYTFENVHVNKAGAPITYTVTEEETCPAPAAQPGDFDTKETCEEAEFVWHEGTCSVAEYSTEAECLAENGTWTAGSCAAD
ncbi:MAG: Cna B-type domain-containing protein [Anaerolineaceae bacterium]|nr:Cna B-type domain-containing protein [Anaerolineaceae bacterium]